VGLRRDGWSGLVVLAASLTLFALTFGLKGSPLVPIGPGFYPRIILGLTAALGAWLVCADLLTRREPEPRAAVRPNYAAVVLHFAFFGLYVALLPQLGFRIATFAYVAVMNAALDPPHGAKGWLRVVVLALATALVTHLVFERYLAVLLPRGRWTGL
jgi:putative tricarboxylic transport membrane protein